MTRFNAIVFCFIVVIIFLFDNVDGTLVTVPQDAEVIVGQNAVINCRTSDVYPVRWEHTSVGSKTSRDVYISKTIVEPYSSRFSIVGNQDNGEYNLFIDSVRLEDSGRYQCADRAGHGERRSSELVVLASAPQCQSYINPDGMIGDNDCGIEPEVITFTCTLGYSGNVSPVLLWKKTEGSFIIPNAMHVKESANEVTIKAVIRPNHEINGHSVKCQTNLTKVEWISDTIKVLYVYNTETSVRIYQSSHETCLANSSQECNYKWTEFDSKETEVTSFINSSIDIDHPGRFICNADCPLRERKCTVQSKSVEFSYEVSEHGFDETAASILQKVWIALAVLVIAFFATSVTGWTTVLYLWRRKKRCEFEYLLKTPVKDALIQGVAVLNGRVYVFRRGVNNVLVYRASDSYDFLREMKDTKVCDPRDAAACFVNKCLYVTDAVTKTVWKMEEKENITTWKPWMEDIQKPYTISVSQEGRVLLPQQPNKIVIYASDISRPQVINLVDDVKDIQHAIELTNGRCLVSHGENNDKKHEVLMVDSDGKTIKRFGKERGWGHDQLYHPRHVTVGDGKVFVADKLNNRIMILDEELKCLKEIRYPEIILNPTRLCYEKGNLMIGQYRALHIVIDVTSDGHSDRKRKTSTLLAAYFHKNDATVNGSSNDEAVVQCLLPAGVA